jgi:hypothetical protein
VGGLTGPLTVSAVWLLGAFTPLCLFSMASIVADEDVFLRRYDMNGSFQMQGGKTGFCRNRSMQTGSSWTLIGWISGQTTFVPLWDRMEGAWLWTLQFKEDSKKQYSRLWSQFRDFVPEHDFELAPPADMYV